MNSQPVLIIKLMNYQNSTSQPKLNCLKLHRSTDPEFPGPSRPEIRPVARPASYPHNFRRSAVRGAAPPVALGVAPGDGTTNERLVNHG